MAGRNGCPFSWKTINLHDSENSFKEQNEDSMKAAVFTIEDGFRIKSIPEPEIRHASDVLLRIHAVGICGSDLHYFRVRKIGEQVVNGPFIMGHECTAVVEEVGANVTRVKPGDRVVVEPAVSCYSCSQCLAGRPHTCDRLQFLGAPGQLDGALREWIVMPEANCFPVPDSLDLATAVLVEPLSIGVYASGMVHSEIPNHAGILGSGPIGLSVLHSIQTRGWEPALVTDKLEDRLQKAQSFGARHVCLANDLSQLQPFEDTLDVVFECCGQQEALDQAVWLLKPGGHLVIVGIPEVDEWTIHPHVLRRKEITLHHVRRQNGCVQLAMDLLMQHKTMFGSLVTHTFPLSQIEQAFSLAATYSDQIFKAVIQIQE